MPQKTLVVAGAGVVGLALARTAAVRGLEVLLLERNALVGQETSARNSEVVHGTPTTSTPRWCGAHKLNFNNLITVRGVAAGIYYAKDSWKAKLCVAGREKLYAFCRDFNVPFSQCGKLIVAHAHQSEQLRAILKRGLQNGVGDLKLLTQREARAIEPQVECHEALFSPSTGIVDSHALMLALQGDAETHGAMVARATAVQGGSYDAKSKTFVIKATQSDGDEQEVQCDYFVNATGMFAPSLLDKVDAPYFKLGPKNRPFRYVLLLWGIYPSVL
jgi:L-2-hydroxyglutarate oxidase LhgO